MMIAQLCTSELLPVTTGYSYQNPVSGKWRLATDYIEYSHSSASFYETGKVKHYTLLIIDCCRGLHTGVVLGQTPVRPFPSAVDGKSCRIKKGLKNCSFDILNETASLTLKKLENWTA